MGAPRSGNHHLSHIVIFFTGYTNPMAAHWIGEWSRGTSGAYGFWKQPSKDGCSGWLTAF
jgi:hypothetical protein